MKSIIYFQIKKLVLKSEFTGGIVMFGIMFAIAILQLYIFKNLKVFKSKYQSSKEMCEDAGGEWTGDRNPEDPCCYQPSINMPASVPMCQGSVPVPFP